MNTSVKMILVLTIIATLSGGLLSFWDAYTSPKIEEYRQEEIKNAVKKVLPSAENYREDIKKSGSYTFYLGYDGDELIGIAFNIKGGGFQDIISLMVGVTPDFSRITGLSVLDQKETPGLGTKIADDPSRKGDEKWFTDQFKGKSPFPEVYYVKNKKAEAETEIEAISGATISSQAVVNILNFHIARAKEAWSNPGQSDLMQGCDDIIPEQHIKISEEDALHNVLPSADRYEKKKAGDFEFYLAYNEYKTSGMAYKSEGKGYEGPIKLLIGLESDFETITGLAVLEHCETPGFGTRILSDPSKPAAKDWFIQQFAGKKISPALTLIHNKEAELPGEIEAVSGATVTSQTIVNIINTSVPEARTAFQSIK